MQSHNDMGVPTAMLQIPFMETMGSYPVLSCIEAG